MEIFGGVIVVALSLLCWGGQLISWLSPATGVRLSLMEAEEDVEPVYFADIRAEAFWDALVLWTMPVAGVLLIVDNPAWPYFGLVGAGMYIYFAGRGIATRLLMRRRNFKIGAPQSVKVGLLFLAIWGLMGLAVSVAAAVSLAG